MLLETKFLPPVPQPKMMDRERLLQRLAKPHAGQMTLLQAPPGYGKTTLVAQWLEQLGNGKIWLSLDERDNDIHRFWNYFIGAIQRFDDGLCLNSQTMLHELSDETLDSFTIALINDLLAVTNDFIDQPLIFVLDDYHVIQLQAVHESLSYFLDNLPTCLHLVIASRSLPPLAIERRKVRDQLCEITSRDLAFIEAETEQFLRDRLSTELSQAAIASLQQRTDGWAAAIQLAAVSMQGESQLKSTDSIFADAISELDEVVIRYLFTEVISNLDQSLQAFVVHTAPLACFSAELLDDIHDKTDSADIIKQLKEKNLFVESLQGEASWFRFHDLFRESLLATFSGLPEAERVEIHRKAGNSLEKMGLQEDAFEHFVAAEEWPRAANLVEAIGYKRALASQDILSETLLRKLPSEVIEQRPKLLLIQAWALFRTNDISPAEQYLSAIETLFSNPEFEIDPDEKKEILSHIAIYRTQIAHISGDEAAAQGLIEAHKDQLHYQDYDLGVRAGLVLDIFVRGDLASINEYVPEILEQAKEENNQFIASNLAQLVGVSRFYSGQVDAGLAEFEAFDQWLQGVEINPGFSPGWSDISLLDLHRELNQFEKAGAGWERLQEYVNHNVLPGQKTLTNIAYCSVLMAMGDFELAKTLLDQAEEDFSDKLSFWSFISPPIDMFKAKLALLTHQLEAAYAWAGQHGKELQAQAGYRREEERLLLARIYIRQEKFKAAETILLEIEAECRRYKRVLNQVRALVLLSLLKQSITASDEARKLLQTALELGAKAGYLRVFLDDWQELEPILTKLRGLPPTLLNYYEVLQKQSEKNPSSTIDREQAEANRKIKQRLTPREIEILWLIKQGLKNTEISERLSIADNTAKVHIRNLYEKLCVKSRTQAVSRAEEIGVFADTAN